MYIFCQISHLVINIFYVLFLLSLQLICIYLVHIRFVNTFLWSYVDFSYNGDSITKKRVAVRLSHVLKIPYETKQLSIASAEPVLLSDILVCCFISLLLYSLIYWYVASSASCFTYIEGNSLIFPAFILNDMIALTFTGRIVMVAGPLDRMIMPVDRLSVSEYHAMQS